MDNIRDILNNQELIYKMRKYIQSSHAFNVCLIYEILRYNTDNLFIFFYLI